MRHSTLQFLLEELWQYTTCFISSRVKTQGMQHLRKPLYLNMMSGIGLIKASAWSLWVKIIDISIEKKNYRDRNTKNLTSLPEQMIPWREVKNTAVFSTELIISWPSLSGNNYSMSAPTVTSERTCLPSPSPTKTLHLFYSRNIPLP